MPSPEISLIIPTLNEAENLPLLVPRIAAALSTRSYEILIVDDNSQDNTAAICAALATQYPVLFLPRPTPKNGLSGAVLHGIAQATGQFLVVMDADLQHPPERLPDLLSPLESNQSDFTLGSRYIAGGSTGEKWTLFRKLNSWVATALARPFAGKTLDPMSGFFALRRETYARAERLTPLGYKIGLELMCKCRVQRVQEIPIHFSTREHGQSKLSLTQQFKYLEHLSRLYDFTYPHASPAVKFLIATASGWFVAGGAFLATLIPFGLWGATVFAYAFAILITAVFHIRYTRTQREFIIRPHPWRDFWIISLAEWIAAMISAAWLIHRLNHPTPADIFFLSFGCATVVRYALRKEFLQDIRGLRRDLRKEDVA